MRLIVIGSGFGGLAAAIRLQAQGHDVTVLEKLDDPGGRARVFRQDGFTFDAGPTIITAPWLIDELFALGGGQTADYVQLVQLDPFYNIRFEDGSVFRYNADREALVAQVRAFAPGDVDGYLRYVERGREIFDAGMRLIDKPFHEPLSMLRVLPDLVRLRADRSVAQHAAGYLRDERLRQVFSFHPLLVGGNPFRASSIYALIHTLEQQWGIWFAMGGTGALVAGLVRLFEELGGAHPLWLRGRGDPRRGVTGRGRPCTANDRCTSRQRGAHRGRRRGVQRRRGAGVPHARAGRDAAIDE